MWLDQSVVVNNLSSIDVSRQCLKNLVPLTIVLLKIKMMRIHLDNDAFLKCNETSLVDTNSFSFDCETSKSILNPFQVLISNEQWGYGFFAQEIKENHWWGSNKRPTTIHILLVSCLPLKILDLTDECWVYIV